MSVDLTDPTLVRATAAPVLDADFISAAIGGETGEVPFELVAGDVLEIRKLPGGVELDAVLLATGTVPNTPAPRTWTVTLTALIQQTPSGPP